MTFSTRKIFNTVLYSAQRCNKYRLVFLATKFISAVWQLTGGDTSCCSKAGKLKYEISWVVVLQAWRLLRQQKYNEEINLQFSTKYDTFYIIRQVKCFFYNSVIFISYCNQITTHNINIMEKKADNYYINDNNFQPRANEATEVMTQCALYSTRSHQVCL